MNPTTDIEQVKSVARALLMTEVYKTPYSPMVVQHPFTSSGFVATTKDGVMQLIDITGSEENLRKYDVVYDAEFRKRYNLGGHMNAMGYLRTANVVSSYIDYIIRTNYEDFKQVGFIGKSVHNCAEKW